MSKKKRIAICKKDGLTMRLEYKFLTEDEFEASLEELASKMKVDVGSIITYTLGDEDEMENGTMYFCPRCGEYNEYGHDPETNMYYKMDKEDNKLKPAGYHKYLTIDCHNCSEVIYINTDKFEEESEKLTEAFIKNKNLTN